MLGAIEGANEGAPDGLTDVGCGVGVGVVGVDEGPVDVDDAGEDTTFVGLPS